MFLVSARVGPFKSIREPQEVRIDPAVTVFVGMNEAGKTVFLQALEKSADVLGLAKFDPVDDYPRLHLPTYLKDHKTKASDVTTLTYKLTDHEVKGLNAELGTKVATGFTFTVTYKYDGKKTIGIDVAEGPVISALAADKTLSSDVKAAVKQSTTVGGIPKSLEGVSLTAPDQVFLTKVTQRIAAAAKDGWTEVPIWEAWQWLSKRMPRFLYFGDYDLLPSKMNLADLAQRVEQAKTNPKQLEPAHRGILALLRMADIDIADFSKPGGYEPLKAKIEGVSISLTDQVMKFWKQNEELEVAVDITTDPEDHPPFNNGPNLYLRIKNLRQRGVSTPFHQRSRGFVWFFSFLVWFDSVQHQLAGTKALTERDLILLLDEPGLSLHALAQEDFLRYIDTLAEKHQVLYTTHSPFMIHNDADRLAQIRTVEDQKVRGTIISPDLAGTDPRTLFPLQAALGWTVAQNLFISKRNLLVEGPSELIYLKALSAALEADGREGLRDDVTLVPTGGLDKVVTFVALLGASGLELAVFHDYKGSPEQKLLDLVKDRMISPKAILNASQFRDLASLGTSGKPSDVEDLFPVPFYLGCFNAAYAKELKGATIAEAALPPGDRIVDRIVRHIADKGIAVRPSGGFNHYRVASHFASQPPVLDAETLARFHGLFTAVNALFK